MAHNFVKQTFRKENLNHSWDYIESCRPYVDPISNDDIDSLRDAFVRFSLLRPWPIPKGGEPEEFSVSLSAEEYGDFRYYLGFGYGIHLDHASLSVKDVASPFDLEGAITLAMQVRTDCLGRASVATDVEGNTERELEE